MLLPSMTINFMGGPPNHISQAYYIPDYTTFWADYNPARENGGYGVLHKSEF